MIRRQFILVVLVLAFMSACSHTPAPVEDRSSRGAPARDVGQLENGIYRVRRDETLYSIAFSHGLDWKDVARWNDIRSPYTIYVGQELKLTEPPRQHRTASPRIATRPAGTTPRATTRQAEVPELKKSVPEPQTTTPAPAAQKPAEQKPTVAPPQPAPTPSAASAADPTGWLWPTRGRVISTYSAGDPARKGINISGTEGQDIVASAAGDVVYSGNGLIGFGELIIIKHSDRMLTAYAHNRTRLVKEGDRVAAGAKIAEMGRNDQEQVMLHFELRVVGKPVDPMQYLPSR